VAQQVPIVSYLRLDPAPHLSASECTSCGARYFDRRNACASCFGSDFKHVELPTDGTLRTYTIVTAGGTGIIAPFVSAIVDCGGTSVRGNVVNIEPTSEALRLGMSLTLTTYSLGRDSAGTEAVGYAFEPAT